MTDIRRTAPVNGALARELRRATHREVLSVASEIGISPAYLSRIERGQRGTGRGVNLDIIERLAAVYGVPTNVLIAGSDKSPVGATA